MNPIATIRTVRLHVRSFGETVHGDGPPFVLLHGLGVSGVVWTAFARRQLSDRTVIAPDLRGHGESDRASDGAYEIANYAADVAHLIHDRFHGTPVALVGHSLGGLVAIEIARHRQDLVACLAVLDPPLDQAHSREVVATVARLRELPSDDLETYLGGFHGVAAGTSLGRLFRSADAGTYAAYLSTPAGAARAWEAAPHVIVPTVLVQADVNADGALGHDVAAEFVRRLPDGQHLHIPGAAHAVHASDPKEVGEAVRALVRRAVHSDVKSYER
jgi:pimeloyl-ACP methyl ester carboxylesterase